MGYYIRILGTQDPDIHIDDLIQSLTSNGLVAKFELDTRERPEKWTVLNILNQEGTPLAQLERNPVVEGELGQEELDEFREEIQHYKPLSAVEWLNTYFESVKVIYAFQMLGASFQDGNFEIVSAIKQLIWNRIDGILQADNEGFSNEDGDHILWQFEDDVEGEWRCAVRNMTGQWDKFEMELGDVKQREEFQNGKVPEEAKRF